MEVGFLNGFLFGSRSEDELDMRWLRLWFTVKCHDSFLCIVYAQLIGRKSQRKKGYFVAQGCIKPLCDLLICPDARIVTVCLEDLEKAEKTMGNTDEEEGLEKIENLQSHATLRYMRRQ
ncbi:hypothetical protein C5167_030373 [Papaver somniferum]|nr:hypothetical protein C5167_030373 [Papaver somniferum]